MPRTHHRKDYRAEESRVFGMLGVVGVIAVGFLLWMTFPVKPAEVLLPVFLSYMTYLLGTNAWYGLRAVHLCFEGDDLLVMRRKGSLMRIPVSGLESVRVGTTVYGLRVVTLRHATAGTFSTLLKWSDVTDFMVRIPGQALPPRWQKLLL